MEKAKKFGSFAGVFTPSLLTILGVIMYMRLGWVVGQAGLISALVIILLAHVISISTGLSISSIATDKKIKAGGIYYILSRSLGLPIGGSIGIALFIGMALSISMYLVGFAESFLGIEVIRNFTGLEQNVMGFRIVGTFAILILVIIAFISTSIAIKTQFYIMAAIGLSLISIFVGFFIHDDFSSNTISLSYLKDGISPEIVFAIFFPAVTGFTAGVAMSGDLKDPKKTIPRGTLTAIACGLIIYVALAVGFAVFVPRDTLLTDYNFLMKIAWFSPFVIAGVWGATLSSALGGILGGPRILQAVSADRITPKIFARGYGASNEPRNALLLIFLIAEAGILIGKLDVIAGIVTMFYLASYGFINLAFYLESWASADFRPSFRVNRYIGLIGFIAAFGVMFKLDMVSMLAAFIVMSLLYVYLRKRQLKTEYGDVWQSVYSSMVRTALHRMNKSSIEQRNWQPNIILFSGGTEKRPHLIEFGKSLVGRHGVLSNFDLIEDKNSRTLFSRSNQDPSPEQIVPGIFIRRKTVRDLYDSIESIAAVYGFAGFEPNTVLMGWARETQHPKRFSEMLKTLYHLDLNVLLLDYDKRTGFGEYKTIDIWWKDVSNQGNLALALCKLLQFSDPWRNAKIRLMIVNSLSEHQDHIREEAEQLLENLRIKFLVKVIDNHIEQRPFYHIVMTESETTDLVITGIPELEQGKEAEYVETTSYLLREIGTVLLIKASSTFKNLSLGVDKYHYQYIPDKPEIQSARESQFIFPEAVIPEEIPVELKSVHASCSVLIQRFHQDYIQPAFKYNVNTAVALEKNIRDIFLALESDSFLNASKEKQRRQLVSLKINQLILTEKIFEEFQKSIGAKQRQGIENGLKFLLDGVLDTVEATPGKVTVRFFPHHLKIQSGDCFAARFHKQFLKQVNSRRKIAEGISYSVKLNRLVQAYLPEAFYRKLDERLNELGQINVRNIFTLQKNLNVILRYFTLFEQRDISMVLIEEAKQEIFPIITKLKKDNSLVEEALSSPLFEVLNDVVTQIHQVIETGAPNQNFQYEDDNYIQSILKKFSMVSGNWSSNRMLLYEGLLLEIRLNLFSFRLQKILERSILEIEQLTHDRVIHETELLNTLLNDFIEKLQKKPASEFHIDEHENQLADRNDFQLAIERIIDKTFVAIKALINRLPETCELITTGLVGKPGELFSDDIKQITLPISQLVDYHVQSNLFEPLQQIRGSLPNDIFSSVSRIRNSIRLVSIGNIKSDPRSNLERLLNETETLGMYPGGEGFRVFVVKQQAIVEQEINRIRDSLQDLHKELDRHVNLATRELTVTGMIHAPDLYQRYKQLRESRKRFSALRKSLHTVLRRILKISAGLWYHQSDALLFAKKISQTNKVQYSLVDSLLTLHEQVSPSSGVLDRLPFYYHQLFLQKYNFKTEFWENRQKEISRIRQAIARYKNGFPGAILIRGERNAGKTFFINYFSSHLYHGHPVYTLNTPPAGSSNPGIFLKTLNEHTGIDGSIENIFGTLEEESLIIIDDLELWWEKSEQGNAVIELIADVIRRFGHKYLFVIAVSNISFQLINQMTGIESCFLSVIDLQPFNARAIREVLMFRHNSSNLEIRLSDKRNSRLTRTAQARLFAHYFKYTRGNIGAALLAWVAHITDIKGQTLWIRQPQIPDQSILKNLSVDLRIYITQFIFHKRLDIPKLQRLTRDPIPVVEKQLLLLKRTGLITERAGHIYELNRFLYIHIKHVIQ